MIIAIVRVQVPPRALTNAVGLVIIVYRHNHAGMAELADAHGSGPCDSNVLRVQVPFPAFFISLIPFSGSPHSPESFPLIHPHYP